MNIISLGDARYLSMIGHFLSRCALCSGNTLRLYYGVCVRSFWQSTLHSDKSSILRMAYDDSNKLTLHTANEGISPFYEGIRWTFVGKMCIFALFLRNGPRIALSKWPQVAFAQLHLSNCICHQNRSCHRLSHSCRRQFDSGSVTMFAIKFCHRFKIRRTQI